MKQDALLGTALVQQVIWPRVQSHRVVYSIVDPDRDRSESKIAASPAFLRQSSVFSWFILAWIDLELISVCVKHCFTYNINGWTYISISKNFTEEYNYQDNGIIMNHAVEIRPNFRRFIPFLSVANNSALGRG